MAMTILGLAALQRKLARIPAEVKKRAQADYMLGGREINMLQRSLAPKDEHTLAGTIRTEPLNDGTIGCEIKAGGAATTKVVKNEKNGVAYVIDNALEQEYGNEHMQANPYFWPGYRARKKKVLRNVRKGVKASLKRAVSGK